MNDTYHGLEREITNTRRGLILLFGLGIVLPYIDAHDKTMEVLS